MSRSFRLSAAVVLAASLLAACEHEGYDTPDLVHVVRTNADSGEFSMAAAPPSAQCPADTGVVLGTWGDTYVGGHDLKADFARIGATAGVKIENPDTFVYTAPVSKGKYTVRDYTRVLGDPQLVRLTDGRLLLLHMSFRGWPFERSTRDGAPLVQASPLASPQIFSSWAEYEATKEAAKGPAGDVVADFARWKLANRQRSEQVFFVSADCGKTWSLHSRIDAKDALGGKCGEPRKLPTPGAKDPEKYLVKRDDGVEEHKYWPGGWDRPELYVDPWSGDTFTTMSCKAGENEEVSGVFMFRLPKGGTTWEVMPYASSGGAGAGQPAWVPSAMTSTKSGALWVATCSGETLHVHRRALGGIASKWETTTVGPEKSCSGEKEKDRYAGQAKVLLHTVAIARSGTDSVRVMWPSKEGERTVYRKANVIHQGLDEFAVVEGSTIRAKDDDASLLNARFIEYDEDVAGESQPKYDAIAYWMESSPGAQVARVRYSVVTAGISFAKPLELDSWKVIRPDATWNEDVDGDGVVLNDHDGQYWAGDYWGGASYCVDHKTTFLLGWPAQHQGDTGFGHDLSIARIMLKDRPCKGLTLLDVPGGKAVPTTDSTMPPSSSSSSSETTASSSTSSSSSSSSTSSSSSSTSSTSSTAAPAPNRVKAITLSMGTCTSVSGQWHCPGTATFELDGGGASSTIVWSAFGTLRHSCTDTTPFDQQQPSFTAAGGQRQASRPFTLVFPGSQQPNGKSTSVQTSVAHGRSGLVQSGPAEFVSQGGCTKP